MKIKLTVLLFFACLLSTDLSAYTALCKDTPYFGYELGMDFYYTYYEFYVPFKRQSREKLEDTQETSMYRTLFKKSIIPKFFLTELSVYPFPYLGVYTRKNHENFYNRAKVTGDLNLIRSICAGFEEPWAFSLLLGNLVSFRSGDTDSSGKAYLGYLVSFGTYHIMDNILIDDNWMEAEWKIKGDRILENRKMSWSFRIGGKNHGNRYIKDILYLSLRRESIDTGINLFSLVRNASYEYTIDIDTGFTRLVRHYFLLSKNFPFKNSRLVFQLQLGFIKESAEKYTGKLARDTDSDNLYYIIRPNLKF
jgi:hypothetical protein